METTQIPNISQKVSRIGLGTWAIGGSLWGGSDEKIAIETILKAFEEKINLLDTAPAYGKGASEETVGKALQKYGKREQVVIATKFGLNQETDATFRDSRKDFIQREIDASLRRLKTDYIDIYQVHWPDPKTPFSETANALHELLHQGKIKAIGVSNFTVEQMDEFKKDAPIHVLQTPFNIFESEGNEKLIPYCLKHGIATLGYGSLCRGLLSGTMSKQRQFKGDDLRGGMDPKFKDPHFSDYLDAAEQLKQWSKKKNHPLDALAVRWVLDSKINVALWGARKPEQLKDVNAVMGWKLSSNDFEEIDQILRNTVKHPAGMEFMAPPVR